MNLKYIYLIKKKLKTLEKKNEINSKYIIYIQKIKIKKYLFFLKNINKFFFLIFHH